jgi:hypothetical protein
LAHLYFADFNHDGVVDMTDRAIRIAHNGMTGQSHENGDVDLDGDVDFADGGMVNEQLGLELGWVE